MIALEPEQCAQSHEISLTLLKDDWALSSLYQQATTPTGQKQTAKVKDWLLSQQNALTTPVILSWDEETALNTTWGTFAHYWDDFCYPSSDDLVVFPDHLEWCVFYAHYEILVYGKKNVP